MPRAIVLYVRWVDRINRWIGRAVMWGIFVMMAILLWSSISKTAPGLTPSVWTLEMAQFSMVAYYILGGPYSMQQDGHVRMDLLYGSLAPRRQAQIDCFTLVFLLIYLGFLLYGGISSTQYAIQYGERSYSAWRPYMAPIKIIMVVGICLMILQVTARFFKDLAAARGIDLDVEEPLGGGIE